MSHSSGGGGTMAFIGATWIRTRTADTSTKKQSYLNEIRIYQYDSGTFTLIATKTFNSTTASPPVWARHWRGWRLGPP